MKDLKFDKTYKVHVYETGPDGRLVLHSLFDYLQDIASEHAVILGFGRNDLLKDNHIWVLSRIFVTIDSWPKWEDTLKITTWPNGIDKMFALRNYEVQYSDGTHIASGTSSWLILDNNTRKIQRPDPSLTHFNFDQNTIISPIRYASKLEPASAQNSASTPFKVKISDLDLNLHTNNVKYLRWVNDTYNLDFVTNNSPKSAEINYLAESRFNEDICIMTSADDQNKNYFNHSIYRTNDNKELCRVRIGWKENTV
jgi:medium-chain acyl-[acyl-carrier-protein] hydrolase